MLLPIPGGWQCKNCNQTAKASGMTKWLGKGKCKGVSLPADKVRQHLYTLLGPEDKARAAQVHDTHKLVFVKGCWYALPAEVQPKAA